MQGQHSLSCSPSRPVPISARHLPRERGGNHTLTVVKTPLTTLKAVVAGVVLEAFSATSKAAIAAFNEVVVPSLRFCRFVVENMVVKVKGVGDNAAATGREEASPI